jgi:hypothetical protein
LKVGTAQQPSVETFHLEFQKNLSAALCDILEKSVYSFMQIGRY